MSSPIIQISGFNTGLAAGQAPSVTQLRGSSSLEELTTVGLELNTLVAIVVSNSSQFWQLVSGAANASDPNEQVQPLDYNSSTNNVHWLLVGAFKDGEVGSQLTNSASQSIPNAVDTAVSFDTVRVNTGEYSSGAPTRFTCITPGLYLVTGGVTFASNGAGERKLFVRKNAGTNIAADIRAANSGDSTTLTVATSVYLNTGDYLELYVNQSSGGVLDCVKAADYTPEFGCLFLGNITTLALSPTASAGSSSSGATGTTVVKPFSISNVGWYRVYAGALPAVGGFELQRTGNTDGSVLDCLFQFGIFGGANGGSIQLVRNVMSPNLQGMDTIRVSWEGNNAYVDVHLNLAGSWSITHATSDANYVDAPYVVTAAGADGSTSLNVSPNIIASTGAIDVSQVNSSGLTIAKKVSNYWAAPTGTLNRTTFVSDSATLAQVAQRLAALIDDALAFGLINAGLPASGLYTDMLGLSSSLVNEGTTFPVTDIFRITAAPVTAIEGIYVPFGTFNSNTVYKLQGYEWGTGTVFTCRYDTVISNWRIYDGNGNALYHGTTPGSPAHPWSVTQWVDESSVNQTVTTVAPNVSLIFNVLTDTHTWLYVTSSANQPQGGIYHYVDTFNGKRRYYQYNGVNNTRIEFNNLDGKWYLKNDLGTIVTEVVGQGSTYPDQVTDWHDATLAIQRLDAVDTASGLLVTGGGSNTDGIYIPQLGVYSANSPIYARIPNRDRFINPTTSIEGIGALTWKITDGPASFGTVYAQSDSTGAFPWLVSWMTNALIAQESHIAGPTNWHV